MLGCRIVLLYFERGPTSAKRITSEKMGEERRRRGTTWEDRGEAVAPAGKSGWAPGDWERVRAVGQGESGWACMRPGEDGGGGGKAAGRVEAAAASSWDSSGFVGGEIKQDCADSGIAEGSRVGDCLGVG